MIENTIQSGIMSALAKVAAPGLPGLLGISIVSQAGWILLLQTVGWMDGLKIALFGIGGFGAFGGAVTFPDGPAYRKTIPTVITLLARLSLLPTPATEAHSNHKREGQKARSSGYLHRSCAKLRCLRIVTHM